MYFINQHLSISFTDKVLINRDVTIKVAAGKMITFFGTLESNPAILADQRSIAVFPNPAKDYIEVNFSVRSGSNTVRIFSITAT